MWFNFFLQKAFLRVDQFLNTKLIWYKFSYNFISVNNVGRMYDYPDELGKLTPDFLWSMLNINMGSVTMMTRMLVNDMKKRGKGAIVNISSGSELQPLPYAAVYGASKVRFAFIYLDIFGIRWTIALSTYIIYKFTYLPLS